MGTVTLVHDCDIERRDDPTALGGDFADSHMAYEFPDTNYGIYYDMQSGQTGGEKLPLAVHAIVLFDLTKFIPASAIITSAVWWFNTRNNFTGPGMEWFVARAGRTDWVEDEVTWIEYKSGSNWAAGGGDKQGTPTPISFGLLSTPGWYNKTVTAMVTDAWSNRGGICSFVLYRDDAYMDVIGYINVIAKDYRVQVVSLPHHLRITYTLAGRTFQVMVR